MSHDDSYEMSRVDESLMTKIINFSVFGFVSLITVVNINYRLGSLLYRGRRLDGIV